MNNFIEYAKYYDLLYKDKDYEAEAEYIHSVIQRYTGKSGEGSILEFGCGTGKHSVLLAKKGYSVCGVDQSSEMISLAQNRLKEESIQIQKRIQYFASNASELERPEKYDVVIALFHVISYQTSNHDLNLFLQSARKHLKPGGLFLFDFWYGPAVLGERPENRIKRVTDSNLEIMRIAEPVLRFRENIVDVHYMTIVEKGESQAPVKITELHRMRYFFEPELQLFLDHNDFEPTSLSNGRSYFFEEWMTSSLPTQKTWGVLCAAKAKV
ncbi:hypothetical protein CH373_12365 [Leptospira perolatii]|uniref:Methyltransferase domain-containing protein n=1 Tax=Leptospira perolatii TaxID=2023191 RepID=A0A2M9ZLB7_9LEPT|nr:class I SAM-dependent methyltransferase [Leptospira perolatii]PJZ70269.1 hypothetical protein CH360_06605 [Leptospira perolatii]PJZ72847.1 hypothetical protein CH373_12365 [Leptospira perolatii]